MPNNRRQFLSAASGFVIASALLPHASFAQQKKPTRIVLLGTDQQRSAGVRKHFSGKVVVGKDLMEV